MNTHAEDGVMVPNIGTESSCLQACIDEPACVAVDVDKIDGPDKPIVCWMHTNVENLKKTSPLQLVDHWVLDRCPTGESALNSYPNDRINRIRPDWPMFRSNIFARTDRRVYFSRAN